MLGREYGRSRREAEWTYLASQLCSEIGFDQVLEVVHVISSVRTIVGSAPENRGYYIITMQ